MNLQFWKQNTEDDDDNEQEEITPLPMPAVMSKADARAARLASTPAPRAIGDWQTMEQPESGEKFERWLIKSMHNLGPIAMTLLIGASVGYFMSDFQTTLTLTSVIGYGGGFFVSLIECALVYKKRLASKAGDDEQALWLLIASLTFGAASIITQIVFLQKFLSNSLATTEALAQLPVLGAVVGVMGGSTFFVIVRACIYHGALYASAWLLSGSKPSLIRQLEWQERQRTLQLAQARFVRIISEEQQPAIALAPAGREPTKDLLAMMQQLQQQMTEMQARQNATTGKYRAVEPEQGVSQNGHSTFHPRT